MYKYIEQIVNVEDDDNCNFQVVFALLGKGENDHPFFPQQRTK